MARVRPPKPPARPPPPTLSVQPLACANCAAPIPLGEGDVAVCPFCGTSMPIPEEHRQLRATRRADAADRAEAEQLFRRLGKPPGPLMRAWTRVAEVVGGVLAVIVAFIIYVGGLLAFVSVFLLEFIGHWLARPLHVDLVDRYGGFGLYGRFALLVSLGVVLPLMLATAYDAFAQVRRKLQAALVAGLPERAGGPSTCRHCHAPLDVPAGALGVTCVYCGSDNLVALPHAWVVKLRREEANHHARVESAAAEERKVQEEVRADRQSAAIAVLVIVPVFALIGKIAVAVDYDVVPPLFASTTHPQRHVVVDDQNVALGEPFRFTHYWGGNVFAGLRAGEVLVVSSATVTRFEATVHSNTTFPFGQWQEELEWKRTPAGDDATSFRAPYEGVFRVHISTHTANSAAKGELRFLIQDHPLVTGDPPAPTLVRREWKAHTGAVESVAWSPSGALLATGGHDHAVVIWDAAAGHPRSTLVGHRDGVESVAFSPDGNLLATASLDHTVKVWSVDGGEPLATLAHDDRVESVAWSPDGRSLASGCRDFAVRLWDVSASYRLERTLKGHTDTVMSVAFSGDGRALASAGFDHTIRVSDPASGNLLHQFRGDSTVFGLAFVPHHDRIATAEKREGSLWSLGDEQFLGSMSGLTEATLTVSVLPDGTSLATGAEDQTVRVWSADTARERYSLGRQGADAVSVSFRPDGRALAAGLGDGRVVVWELPAAAAHW